MKRIGRILLWIAIIVILAGAGFWFYRSRTLSQTAASAAGSYTQVVEVKQGSLRANLSVVGELAAVQSADLLFDKVKGSTRLESLAVQVGNTVKAGQVLATIDPAPYQQALDQAKSDLQAAEKKLADLKTPVTQLKFAQADLAVVKAEYQLAAAQDSLDKLVNPDIAELQRRVADAETALAKARADLAALKADKTSEDKLFKLRETEAKTGAEQARLAGETYADAYHQDRVQVAYNAFLNAQDARVTAELQAQANILKAEIAVSKAEKTLSDAQEALTTARAGGDPLALAKARVAVKDAEVALAAARETRTELDKGSDATALAAAQADVDKKRLALSDAVAALAGTKLTAPFDGTVLKSNVAVNRSLNANTIVLTIANLKELQVLASVDETKIRQVKAGQSATLSFDALPGQSFRGQVLSVPLQGALQGNVMVYEVPVSLTGAANQPLLVGMTANVQIALGQVENALLIPAMAVTRASGRNQVLVPNASDPKGEPEAVPVEIGLSDGVNTQIVKGLNLGDKVVMQMASSTQNNPFNFGGGGGGVVIIGGPGQGAQPQQANPARGR